MELEQGFQTLIELALDVIAVLDEEATIQYYSPSAQKVLGYEPHELLGKNAFENVHPEDQLHVQALFAYALQNPSMPLTVGFRFRHANGEWRSMEGVGVNLLNDQSIKGIVLNFRDVTDKLLMEQSLRESEAQLRTLVTAMTDVIIVLDADGRYLSIAPTNPALLYKPAAEIIGKTLHEVFPPSQAEFFLHHITRSLESHRTVSFEYSLPIGGKDVWFAATLSPMLERSVLLVARDITERKNMENALRASEERLRFIVSSTPAIIYAAECSGKFNATYMSENVTHILGYSPEEYTSRPDFWVSNIHPEDVSRVLNELPRVFDKGHHIHEYRFRHKNGSYRWMHDEVRLILGEDGKPKELAGYWIDITDRKNIGEELARVDERFRAFVQQSSDIITLLAPDGTISYCSPSFKTVLGYEPEYALGKNAFDFVHPDDVQDIQEVFAEVVSKTNLGLYTPYRARHADGSWVFLESIGNNMLDNPAVGGIVLTSRDISARMMIEEALLQSEEKYRRLVELSPIAICIHCDGKFVYANQAAAHLWGAEHPEQLMGMSILERFHPEDRPKAEECLDKVLSGRVEFGLVTLRSIRLDGTMIHVQSQGIRVNYQGVQALQTVILDITDRVNAEEALRKSEERFRSLVQHSSDIIAVLAPDGTIQYVTPSTQDHLGYSSGDLVGKNALDFIHPEDAAIVRAYYENRISVTGSVAPVELRFRRSDGSWAFLETIMSNLIEDPSIKGVVINARDVTERKQAEEKIREQAALLDEAQDTIGLIDLNDCFLYWNKSAERLYGWSLEEIHGKAITDFLYEGNSAERDEVRATVLQTGNWNGELRHRTKDGRKIIVQSRWTLVNDTAGIPKAILFINTDITEKKALEAQFHRAQRMEGIGTLAGGIAHDLNNILAPILLAIDSLRRSGLSNEDIETLDILETSASRAADLVKQVLTFARGLEGVLAELQVRHLISEMVKIALETFPRNISVQSTVSKDLWPIRGDATQMHQVLLNLFINARDAMPDGGTLSISAQNRVLNEIEAMKNIEAKPGNYVVVQVSDTGSGIPKEIFEKIFEPFFTTKAPSKGSGLGLSTALGIVKAHNGFIEVESGVETGSTFRVFLPALETRERKLSQETKDELPQGEGELILVVDDEDSILEIARNTLQINGYIVLTATNGADALALYSTCSEDLAAVIIDMMMPEMDGLATIKALRKLSSTLHIIISTGTATDERIKEAKKLGVKGLIQKPYTAKTLLVSLNQVLKGVGIK